MHKIRPGPASLVSHRYLVGVLAAGLSAGALANAGKGEEAITFEANSGETTSACAGTFPCPSIAEIRTRS
jgi:hypothetical protein